jgi:hypothetical protein
MPNNYESKPLQVAPYDELNDWCKNAEMKIK